MPDPRQIDIHDGDATVHGDLTVPPGASGLVVFAHGSGSSRHSPRNRFVAEGLQDGSLATLLMDLLSDEEERVDVIDRRHRFDIDLLAGRLEAAMDGLADEPDVASLPLGLFGASTGAAAALVAAARRPDAVKAVVSRGGRPDLAGDALESVRCATLLIVGGDDRPVIGMNEEAAARMPVDAELRIVPGATHLFEEPGALEQVVEHARAWFTRHLVERAG